MLARCATNDSEEVGTCHFRKTATWKNPAGMHVNSLPGISYDSIFVVTAVHNTPPSMSRTVVFNTFSTVWVCVAVLVVMFTVMKMFDPRFSLRDTYTWHDMMQNQKHQQRRSGYTINGNRKRNGDGGSVADERERQSNCNMVRDMTERSTGQLINAASKSKRVAVRSKWFALNPRICNDCESRFKANVRMFVCFTKMRWQ